MNESPCGNCETSKNCHYKDCLKFRVWFATTWERARCRISRAVEKNKEQNSKIKIPTGYRR